MAIAIRRVTVLLCSVSIVLATLGTASAGGPTDQTRAERGIAYLRSQQRRNGSIVAFSEIGSTADAVLAVVSAAVGPRVLREAVAYLRVRARSGDVRGIGLKAKVVLALIAAGERPRWFGRRNLVRQIRSSAGPDGHLGNAPVFDQAHGVLALVAAGANLPPNATGWLLDAQCPDGGWAYDAPYDAGGDDTHCVSDPATDFFSSDTNTTSYVVQALGAAGAGAPAADPFAFFDSAHDPVKGGWAYSTAFIATDANSTALVLQAYAVAGAPPPPAVGLDALRALQFRRCGAWAYSYEGDARTAPDVGATIGAVPGLLLDPLPITGPVQGAVPRLRRCPGA